MTMKTYTTLAEAIQSEIIDVIEQGGKPGSAQEVFDIAAIAELVIFCDPDGGEFYAPYGPKAFWNIVDSNARRATAA